ncbi:MAG: hypothetical protein PV344_02650, partial [Anaplasma sp.]|nr:hypothetical protein [Anaplasma sp.]
HAQYERSGNFTKNAIALSGPLCIAFSFASHALESHNYLVLMTQHSFPKPCKRVLHGLVSSVSGSQPKGRGLESRLKVFKFFFKAH